ncbi:unnamed protein product [Caenorhabditis sp. 36 PRJEB53466]|nr:unnamed protein product [Caenorhabditis sp. 36 PRJEB53466]
MMSEEQFNKLLERLTGNGGRASVEERRTQKIDSITARLKRFEYDPENGITFSHWYDRYGEMLTEEGADLNEATRRRLLIGALGEMEYNRFANRVLPKKVNELSWNETVKALKTCFAATKSVFQERFEFLRMSYSGGTLSEYTGFVRSQFGKMTDEQICCLVWTLGLRTDETEVRVRALQILETKPDTTLVQLEEQVTRFLTINADAKAIGGVTGSRDNFEVNAVRAKPRDNGVQSGTAAASGSATTSKSSSKSRSKRCDRCGWRHNRGSCSAKNARCFGCNEKGHFARFCPNSREANGQALVVGSVHASKESVKIREMVKIKTVPIEMMVDTGSDVTMLSVSDWEKIGKPRLKAAREKILTVDKKPMKIMGRFECNFKWRGYVYRGRAYVGATASILGLDWINMNGPWLQAFMEGIPDDPVPKKKSPKKNFEL